MERSTVEARGTQSTPAQQPKGVKHVIPDATLPFCPDLSGYAVQIIAQSNQAVTARDNDIQPIGS
jgi:hypothetical protein